MAAAAASTSSLKFHGKDPAIPPNSLILVTGANGFIARHVCDQFLKAGYRVRGTSRAASKMTWLHDLFDSKYGKDRFESAVVEDMASPNAFDAACNGVKGVCHVASILSFSPDPNAVIPTVIAGARNAAASAKREGGVSRFVYTSSSTAITAPKPGKKFTVSVDNWNDEDVEAAWKPPPYEPQRAWAVYGASKTQAERAMWEFMREKDPPFTLNTVLPNANMGPVMNDQVSSSTGEWARRLFRGELDAVKDIPPQWMVNVQDTARVHVGALLDPDMRDERIIAFAYPFNWNDVLGLMRKLYPGKTFPQDIPNEERDLSELDNSKGAELLKAFGRDGWTGLEESIKENVQDM